MEGSHFNIKSIRIERRSTLISFYFSEFPAGILQGKFFNSDRPKYMNYGAVGFVMGHEMTHGFDDQGRQFDKEGNLIEWWEPETKKKYLERAQCIIDQYSNFTVKEVGLNVSIYSVFLKFGVYIKKKRFVIKLLIVKTDKWQEYSR